METPRSPLAATQAIAAEMTRLLTQPRSESAAEPPLVRAEAPMEPAIVLDWLRAQRGTTRYYWADREGDFEMAGVGEADVLVPLNTTDTARLFRHIRQQLSPYHPSLRYYGGFRFHRGPVKGASWKSFKEYRFVVPRFELLRRTGGTFLCCNARLGHPRTNQQTLAEILAALAQLQFPDAPVPMALPNVLGRSDAPDRPGWDRLIRRALDAFARGDMEKVVLARETQFTAAEPWDPVSLLSRLVQHGAPGFEFCFHPAPDRAFIGASPERLFKRTNCYLQSEALAGTRPRGKTDESDRQFAQALLESEKERREHALVVNTLQSHLRRFCPHLNIDEKPSLMRLRNVQHLWTRIEGILDDVFADADLIETLHPTPAVGGLPRDRALQWIADEEPFDRGIFAAPVGWIGYDATEFCVAIRSGLVQDRTLSLYTGAGIVAGSQPEEEWNEIENKMAGFAEVLTGLK